LPNFEIKKKNPPHFDADFSLLTIFKLGFLAMYTSSKDLLPFNAKSLFWMLTNDAKSEFKN
jgi:hypothetical protein